MFELLHLALLQMIAARPQQAEFALPILTSSIQVLDVSEQRFRKIAGENPKIAGAIEERRVQMYEHLFTTKGVSKEVAHELVRELIAA